MAPPSPRHQLFLGTFIHCKDKQHLEYLHEAAVFVDGTNGKIIAIEPSCSLARAEGELFKKLGWDKENVTVTETRNARQFFFPGFIDTHVHASQYPNVGIFGSTTLLDWLETYTFPLEASLADLSKARRVYTSCVRKTLAHGTTAASYFATRDVAATNLLADICARLGQRAFVGRVAMDRKDTCPAFYRDGNADVALQDTRATIEHVTENMDQQGRRLVTPIITPRFAPTTTDELLAKLGDLHKETGLPIQTHISENNNEIALVRRLFGGKAYADVYDAFGLLTPRTILAHAVWLTDAEADLVAARGSKVSHCPCSNSSLTSGAARLRWLWGKGIGVGLGTDMSGGYSPSVLESARQASLVSRHVAITHGGEEAKLSVEEVLYLATRGGAEVMGLEDTVGGFEVGMDWDAQLVGMAGVDEVGVPEEEQDGQDLGTVDVFGWESWGEMVAKWVFGGDDRNTTKVWVAGRLVHERRK